MLNGFGPADEIEKIVSDLKRQHNVGVMYSTPTSPIPTRSKTWSIRPAPSSAAVDILVNNAGIQHVDPIEEFPVDKWNAIIAINLSGAFHTCRLAVPDMKKERLGTHHQCRLRPRAGRLSVQVGLCISQARPRRIDQDRGA